MKTTLFYLFLGFISILTGSCKDDSADNPIFREDEIPYIYTDMLETTSAIAGEKAEFKVLVSPADERTSVKWLLDGEVIGTTASLVYTFPKAGTFKLRIEVTRNGLLNYRNFTLTVIESTTGPEEPEEPTNLKNIIFGYLSNGILSGYTIPWDNLTHLCIAYSTATAEGDLSAQDLSNIQTNLSTFKEGQAKGVKILMSINISKAVMDAMTIETRTKLKETALKVVTDFELDGLDINFEGWDGSSTGTNEIKNAPRAANLKGLCKELKEELAEGKQLTVAVKADYPEWNNGWGYYNSYDIDMFQYVDYINVMVYSFTGSWGSSPVAQHAGMDHFKGAVKQWSETNGIAKNKLIMGVPAYGIEFQSTTTPIGGKHLTYKAILGQYSPHDPANDEDGEFTASDGKYVVYNGKPTVKAKAEYVRENGFAGIMIFEISEDSSEKSTSLTQVVYDVFTTKD